MEDPERRAKIASSVGLLIFLNVPLVYMSVKWWRSLHQVQSSPGTMDPSMVLSLRLSAFAFLAVCLVLLSFRLKLAKRESEKEAP
jgi:heme exporter protein C